MGAPWQYLTLAPDFIGRSVVGMKAKIALAACLVALSLLASAPVPASAQQFSQLGRLVVIYAPAATFSGLKGSIVVANHSEVLRVQPRPPYDYLVDLLKLVDPTFDYVRVGVVNESFAREGGALIPLAKALNQTLIGEAWAGNFTVFVNVPGVDPSGPCLAINPYFNVTGNYIPPAVLTVPINGSAKWGFLNATVALIKTSSGFQLNLTDFNAVMMFDNATLSTEPYAVSVPENHSVAPGVYYMVFKIVEANETHAVLLFPGALMSSGWLSSFYGSFSSAAFFIEAVPDGVLSSLPPSALLWLYNQTLEFYRQLVLKATWYTSGGVYLLYYPAFLELERLRAFVDAATYAKMLNMTAGNLDNIIITLRNFLGVNTTVAIYSPYTPSAAQRPLELDAPQVLPGVYNITGRPDVAASLAARGVDFEVRQSRGSALLYLLSAAAAGLDDGYLVVAKPYALNETLSASATVGEDYVDSAIRSFGKLAYPSAFLAVRALFEAQQAINNMTSTISSLRDNVNALNQTVNVLLVTAGNCNASVANLTARLLDMESRVEGAERLMEQAKLFLAAGVAASAAFSGGVAAILARAGRRGRR